MSGSGITVQALQDEVHAFAEETFGPGREDAAWKKLFEELGETLKNPRDPSEWADVFILLLDLAKLYGVDVGEASVQKMAVLRTRVWTKTETGVMQHVPGAVKTSPDGSRTGVWVLTDGGPYKLEGGHPALLFNIEVDAKGKPPLTLRAVGDIGLYTFEETLIGLGNRRRIHRYKYWDDGVPF